METTITVKKEVNVKSEIDVTIQVPYFCKSLDGTKHAKIYGDGQFDCLRVNIYKGLNDIYSTMAKFVVGDDYVECTEIEFLTVFNEASNHLSKIANS